MVDFNNDSTIGTPAVDIERISILQRRYHLIEAYEEYKIKKYFGSQIPIHVVRARMLSLFIEIQATLKRRLKKNEYDELRKKVISEKTTDDEVYELIETINEELDEMRLTRVDTQKVYDSTDVEAENEVKGY